MFGNRNKDVKLNPSELTPEPPVVLVRIEGFDIGAMQVTLSKAHQAAQDKVEEIESEISRLTVALEAAKTCVEATRKALDTFQKIPDRFEEA